MRQRTILTMAAIAAAALLLPASAAADFQTFYDDYRADGVIDGCSQSPATLSSALNDIPADVREYDPGFAEAVNAALEQSATGCDETPADQPGEEQAIAADGSPGPAPPGSGPLPDGGEERELPPILVALIAVLGVALAGATFAALARRLGF